MFYVKLYEWNIKIEYIPLLTGATLENIVRLQLIGHDHAVKVTQLSSRYQHSAVSMIS